MEKCQVKEDLNISIMAAGLQLYIDNFLKELDQDAPKTPLTKLAHDIASIFNPNKERDENAKNNIKTNIVKIFDNAINDFKPVKVLC